MSIAPFTIKRGDTAPAFRAQLLNGSTPVDLSTAVQVRIHILRPDRTKVTKTAVVETDPGWVRCAWVLTDLPTTGTYLAEVEVTWNDTTVQTFPATGYATIQVDDHLDP